MERIFQIAEDNPNYNPDEPDQKQNILFITIKLIQRIIGEEKQK